METTVDKFGRIVLPKRVRDQLGIESGSVIDIEPERDGIRLRPHAGESTLVNDGGVLVFTGTMGGDLLASVDRHRAQRLATLGSKTKNDA